MKRSTTDVNTSAPAAPTANAGRRWARHDTRHLLRLLVVVAALHVLGWGVLGLVVVPHQFSVGEQVFGWGLGLTAYLFGVRHAFDADHIAVIDSTTRQLTGMSDNTTDQTLDDPADDAHKNLVNARRRADDVTDGRALSVAPRRRSRPVSVGFWFSLGHSSVVFAMAILVATGVRFAGGLVTGGTTVNEVLSTFGTTAAGVFLWVIGLVNLATLLGIARTARQRRRGQLDDAALAQRLALNGVLARVFRRATSHIRSPRQVYPVGLLMGLGFDTATEVALLVLAGTAAVTLPWYAVLVLPVLFTAGMALFDTLDGAFMNVAYDWALSDPLRRLTYNGLVTAISVAIALGIGTVQLVSVAHDEFGLHDRLSTAVAGLDTQYVGYAVAGVFIITWAAALAWWRTHRPASSIAEPRPGTGTPSA